MVIGQMMAALKIPHHLVYLLEQLGTYEKLFSSIYHFGSRYSIINDSINIVVLGK